MSWGKLKLRKADQLFSQYIRIKHGKCLRCHKPVEFNHKGLPITHQASHFQGRRKESTRFDEDNATCLCASCHRILGENPAEHYQFQLDRLGQKDLEALILRSNLRKKRDDKMEVLLWSKVLKDLLENKNKELS